MAFIQMVDLVGLHQEIETELQTALQEVILSSDFIQGKPVVDFLEDLKQYLKADFAIGCGNGTDALQLALMALDLPAGSEIIVPAFTYVSAAEAVALLGYRPVFVDVDPDTFNINPSEIAAKITGKTKAIIPVHLFGQASDMQAIQAIVKAHNLYVIEDNAQALGAKVLQANGKYKHAGIIGTIGTTSFFPTKVLGGMGDGGAVFTADEDLAIRIKQLANHGQKQKYNYGLIGINSRLDSLQATILKVKLKFLDSYIVRRQQVAAWYKQNLNGLEHVKLPEILTGNTHVYSQYVIKVKDNRRDALQEFLKINEIATAVYYHKPLHLQPAYAYVNNKIGDFPVAEKLCEEVLALPMYPLLTQEQVTYISQKIVDFYKL